MRTLMMAGLLILALACTTTAEDKKGTVVKVDNLSSTTPTTWEKETPASTMRYAQFKLPKVKGDKEDAQLIIFKGFGGSAKANVDRWKGQFVPDEGKTEAPSKQEEFKVAGCEVTYFDISGTYLDGAPMVPASKKKKKAGFRMLAVQFEGPENAYHIMLRGPEATIKEHKKGFDEWLKGFKK